MKPGPVQTCRSVTSGVEHKPHSWLPMGAQGWGARPVNPERLLWCPGYAKGDAVEEVNAEVSELRAQNERQRRTVAQLQEERDSARQGVCSPCGTLERQEFNERIQAGLEAYRLRTVDWERDQLKAQLSAVCGERDELEMQLATQKLRAEAAEELAADRLKSVRAHQARLDERARKLNLVADEIRLLERQARPFGDHAGAAETLKRLVELSKPWTRPEFRARPADAKTKRPLVLDANSVDVGTLVEELEELAWVFDEWGKDARRAEVMYGGPARDRASGKRYAYANGAGFIRALIKDLQTSPTVNQSPRDAHTSDAVARFAEDLAAELRRCRQAVAGDRMYDMGFRAALEVAEHRVNEVHRRAR